jgi:hypothetical protein
VKATRKSLISELAAIRRIQAQKLSWFRQEDYARLRREFATKSAALVELELAAYNRKISPSVR